MKVLITSSSSKKIDPYYLSIARHIANFLANNECDLIFGGASFSMMGICYQEFLKKERYIYSYTTSNYIEDLKNLINSEHIIESTTLDLKKNMFLNSDLVVCLPGGLGTFSELLAYIEEKRSNNNNIPIIIYDEDNFFNRIFNIEELIKLGFANEDIYNTFIVAKNKDEFEDAFIKTKGRGKKWKN